MNFDWMPFRYYYERWERHGAMFKRFVIGFLLGVGAMYWWIHNSSDWMTGAQNWMERSASNYRGDRDHSAVRRETGQ